MTELGKSVAGDGEPQAVTALADPFGGSFVDQGVVGASAGPYLV